MGKNLIIGITGPSGSGKTQITKILNNKNYLIINADLISHKLLAENKELHNKIIYNYSNIILDNNNQIDRKKLGKIVFSDPKKLELLNNIIFPYIKKDIKNKIKKFDNKIIILDAPTLIESKLFKICDKIIVVLADKNILLERIIKRDKISLKDAKNRLDRQLNDKKYIKVANYILYNNGNIKELDFKINEILKNMKGNFNK